MSTSAVVTKKALNGLEAGAAACMSFPQREGEPRGRIDSTERLRLNALRSDTMPATADLDAAQREQLLLEHLPQVQYIARRIHDRLPPQVLLEDLVHAGILGLMDAVRKYDPSKNVRLKYYAEFRIRGAILDSLRQVDWSPRALRRQARRLEQAISACKLRLSRDPTEPEIADELQVDLQTLQRLRGDIRGLDIGSLRDDINEPGAGEEALQYRPGSEEEDPYFCTLRSEMTGLLATAMGELPARDREVLALYHFQEFTMKKVGAVLGIGESRISQINASALRRLRERLCELLDRKAPRMAVASVASLPLAATVRNSFAASVACRKPLASR
jgi:RNA polymerase sigma factor FliA